MGKRRRQITNNRVLRIGGDDRGSVLVVMGFFDCLKQRSDIGLLSYGLSFYGCGCHDVFPLIWTERNRLRSADGDRTFALSAHP
jgi:hypothetical protein